MTKILYIISSLQQGGAENLLAMLLASLDRRYQATVLYIHDGPIRTELERMAIPCHQIKGLVGPYDPFFFIHLWKLLKQIHPDLIHTHLWAANICGTLLSVFTGIPVITTLHTPHEHEGALRNTIDRLLLPATTHMVAVSPSVARSIAQKHIIPATRLSIISNGINSERLYEQARRTEVTKSLLGWQESDFVYGSVGRLVKLKNYDLLIHAFAELHIQYQDTKLLLVGHGPEEASLRSLIELHQLTDHVTLISGQKAAPYYRAMDCFVQPSQYEGLSLALMEALAHRIACITTASAYGHDILTHGINGYLIEPNNIQALMHALEELYLNSDDRNRYALQGYQLATSELAHTTMIAAYQGLYEHVLKNSTK